MLRQKICSTCHDRWSARSHTLINKGKKRKTSTSSLSWKSSQTTQYPNRDTPSNTHTHLLTHSYMSFRTAETYSCTSFLAIKFSNVTVKLREVCLSRFGEPSSDGKRAARGLDFEVSFINGVAVAAKLLQLYRQQQQNESHTHTSSTQEAVKVINF